MLKYLVGDLSTEDLDSTVAKALEIAADFLDDNFRKLVICSPY
jgi:hypothetical protein